MNRKQRRAIQSKVGSIEYVARLETILKKQDTVIKQQAGIIRDMTAALKKIVQGQTRETEPEKSTENV